MREILFRGKRVDNNKWVVDNSVLFFKNSTKIYGALNEWREVEVIPETVGQCTGLTDKNGTRIFEGDIIKQNSAYKEIIGCVQICKEPLSKLYGVCEKFHDGSGTALLSVDGDYEVIGNIFDNPELLRGEKE